jgi:hypothetical protein
MTPMKKLNTRVLFLSVAMSAVPGLSNAGYMTVYSYAAANGIGETNNEWSFSNPVSVSNTVNDHSASASSFAFASIGVLKIAGVDSAVGHKDDFDYPDAVSDSSASWGDEINISAQGIIGEAFLTANILVQGNVTAGSNILGNGLADSIFQLYLNGGQILNASSGVRVDAIRNEHYSNWTMYSKGGVVEGEGLDEMFRLYTFDIPILLGTDFSLSATLIGSAQANAIYDYSTEYSGFGFASYDLGHSLYWAGISALRDANGNLITDYSLTSGSRVDYRNSLVPVSSVPAPPAFWLLLSGIIGLSLVKRKNHRPLSLSLSRLVI